MYNVLHYYMVGWWSYHQCLYGIGKIELTFCGDVTHTELSPDPTADVYVQWISAHCTYSEASSGTGTKQSNTTKTYLHCNEPSWLQERKDGHFGYFHHPHRWIQYLKAPPEALIILLWWHLTIFLLSAIGSRKRAGTIQNNQTSKSVCKEG